VSESVFDTIIQRTHGYIAMKDLRVIWKDGKLYLAKSPTDITVLDCPQPPTKSAGTWKTIIEDKGLRLQTPSCGSCRARMQRSAIGQMTVDQIVEAAALLQAQGVASEPVDA